MDANKHPVIDAKEALDEFFEKFEPPKDPEFWKKLVNEEANEVMEAFAHLIKELCDLGYVLSGLSIACDEAEVDMLDITPVDAIYGAMVIMQSLDEYPNFEPVLQEAFAATHKSNMSKLGDDGKPIRREDGKILKGPNYKAPDILSIVTKGYVGER
ncbi:hypothetical protein [Maritalea mediterranea]|uniref:Phosphoribosyl-ATP pyrophosphohydrolase n=1 Tax=Maritalea mediterranea TaxID=2909667 RepID=A0ABS9EAA3_9HYPH|nr:hypothetical protein [Maritalea mediterranea]MCF4099800.1 hypothetical protein [Maritalea mediterranea]